MSTMIVWLKEVQGLITTTPCSINQRLVDERLELIPIPILRLPEVLNHEHTNKTLLGVDPESGTRTTLPEVIPLRSIIG